MENNDYIGSTMESEKKKIPREVLPLYKRIRVIESATAGLSQRQLAEKFSCGKTQISNILKNKDALLKEWEENNHRKSVKRKRKSVYENVNRLVLEWYKRATAEGQHVNPITLQEKALEYAEALNLPAFKASNGWLDNMRRRYGILCNGMIGENSVDTSKDEQAIPEIIEGYDPQDIYNLGEAGLLFRALPDKSLIEKGKECQGGRLSNERLTIGFCCNAVGEKEIPVVISRSKEPLSFKGMDLTSLGIKHRHSKKAWMTSEIFEEWINELNERMRNRKKRVLILVDYAPCHPDEISLSNVSVKFLPPNPLSPLQPLDQGIIQSFKVLYRKNLLKMIFSRTSNPAEFSSFAKSLTLFDAVQFIKLAWNEVSTGTIQRCFSACGLSVLIPQSNEEGRSLNELKLLCSASQINDCTFCEDVEFCEDRPCEWEDEMETDSSASKEANSESSESDDEEELHMTEFKPYTTLEAFEAIGRLKATFKVLDPDKLIQINEKLDILEYEIQDSVVEQKKAEGSSIAEPGYPITDMQSMEEERLDVASLSSISSFNIDPPDINAHLHSIKQEIQLLTTHFISLKQISQFLLGIFNMFEIEDKTIKDLLTKILDEVKEFIFNLDDLEYSVTLVGNTISQEDRTTEFQKVIKLKESLLSKLLGCYSNIITIFQTCIQKQNSARMSKSEEDQITLLNQLRESEQRCISQSAVIKDLERKLSIIQGKANTMESYKSTLEDTRTELQKQLSYKEAQIQYLTAELSQLSTKERTNDNEKLLEIIEEIKKNAQAEKTALKKALKVQKSRAEKLEQFHVKSEKELKEKEKMLLDIASQRDKLKLHLTVANNNIIEGKNQIEEMKHQNLKLQNEMSEKEGDLKRQLQEMSSSLNEKSAQLNDCLQENMKLERDFSAMTNELETTKRELNKLKTKFSDATILSHGQGDGNHGNPLLDVKQLILLLQNTQEQLKNIKSAAVNTTMSGGDNSAAEGKTDMVCKTLLKAVDEIKEHLLDLKNRVLDSKEDNRKSELEMKLKELQKLYTSCSKENHALKTEIEELKNTRWNNSSVQPNEISYIPENENCLNSVKTVQMELRLKNEENWRLKQREKDLEHQLEQVKDKLQKKEAENFRLYSLEEELKLRKNEISLLEKKKEEESERLLNRIKELQKALDETTADCDRLKRYVQDLRASYLNVFGGSS